MKTIHSSAVVDPKAELADGVEIGPYCTVGPHVTLGEGTRLVSHAVIDGHTRLGARCTVFPFASLGTQTQDLKYKGGTTYVEIGDANTFREYVTVNSGTSEAEVTRVGSHCHIMAYAHIAHGCVVGSHVIMANAATLAGHIEVEDMATIGGLTGVHQFVRIGLQSFIGGMTRVVKDVPPYMLIEGNPAEVRGINSVGMERRGASADVIRRVKLVFHVMYRENLSTRQAVDKIKAEIEPCPEVQTILEFVEKSERGITK